MAGETIMGKVIKPGNPANTIVPGGGKDPLSPSPDVTGKTYSLLKQRRRTGERLIEFTIRATGLLAIVILSGVFLILVIQGIPAFFQTSPWEFLAGDRWQPYSDPPVLGISQFFVATLWVAGVSTLLAVPVGIGCAIYLAEIAPKRIADIIKPLVELLSGFPSVVIGFIGLALMSPWVQTAFDLDTGLTGFTAGIMLSMMSLPVIVSVSEDALRAVPDEFRQAAYGLGATRWETILHVSLPSAVSGVSAAVMLGIGRAIGETMTVLMVAGGAMMITTTPFEPMMPMPAAIASGIGNAVRGGSQYQALFGVGLLLFIMTFIVNLIAARVMETQKRKFARS
jgi:phosphate transport system permease protein